MIETRKTWWGLPPTRLQLTVNEKTTIEMQKKLWKTEFWLMYNQPWNHFSSPFVYAFSTRAFMNLCGCQYILSFSLCDCIQKNSFETHHFLSLARFAYYRWVERWMDRMVIMSSQGGILSPISLWSCANASKVKKWSRGGVVQSYTISINQSSILF